MKITVKKLKELKACPDGIKWFKEHKIYSLRPLINALLKDDKWNYARWLLSNLMTHQQQVAWSIFSIEHPDDGKKTINYICEYALELLGE